MGTQLNLGWRVNGDGNRNGEAGNFTAGRRPHRPVPRPEPDRHHPPAGSQGTGGAMASLVDSYPNVPS
jgi:hypothetical protein